MKTKKIKIPIYYGTLIIIISEDYPAVAKKYGLKMNTELYGAFTWTHLTKSGHSEYILCIDQNISNHLIAHECVHLVNAVFSHTHIELDRQNDEPQAYLTAWFFKEIEKFLIATEKCFEVKI